MSDLAYLVPVLGRPHRIAPLLDAIEATTPGARVVFMADPDDLPTKEMIRAQRDRDLTVDLDGEGGSYAEKINRGVRLTREPYLFSAADDLEPKAGWYEAAREAMVDGVEIVGINDLIDRPHRPEHATHFLLARAYAEQPAIDGSEGPFFTGYSHWFCDDELIGTAEHRGAYAYAPDAQVLHFHPIADTAPDDDTYRAGRSRVRQDRKLHNRRKALWT